MADTVRMALAELLRKAAAEPDVDVLREGVRVLAEAVMDLEVEQHLGADRHEREPGAQRAAQRVSGAGLGHAGRDDRSAGAAGAGWELLPGPLGAADAGRAGAGGRGPGGLRRRRLHAPGGRVGQGVGAGGDQQEPGVAPVCGAG